MRLLGEVISSPFLSCRMRGKKKLKKRKNIAHKEEVTR
jgi:hypothetical protein